MGVINISKNNDIETLHQLQALPLYLKIKLTESRIREWVNHFGTDGVYVAFSGGKDSTVLLNIVRNIYPDVEAVFVDTGLEYPEIRDFVKTYDNVTWIKPSMNFKQVIQKYGYPFISKEVSECVYYAQKYLEKLEKKIGKVDIKKLCNQQVDKTISYWYGFEKLTGSGKYKNQYSKYSKKKWMFLLNAPFKISNQCCNVMKKHPSHKYQKDTGKAAITAQMASESMLRTQQWIQNGCNGFDMKRPISNPMSFWTEQDVLLYIKLHDITIAPVYGDVVTDDGTELDEKINYSELSLFDLQRPLLKTTGYNRTGCVFCGFGCHLEDESRFKKLKETHPKLYDYLMKPTGLNYKFVIDWINKNGDFNIRY